LARWLISTTPRSKTVRQWFRDNYGPNNAVLVLAGDINAAEARPLS
jgi:predicted Zn-dependent peptidase